MEVCRLWSAIGHTGELIHMVPPSRKRDLFAYGHVEIAHVLPPPQERNMDLFLHGNISEKERNNLALGYIHCDSFNDV